VVIQTLREKAMTNLEKMLAGILQLIDNSRAAGNALALTALMQRKDAICAALAAPEQH
jgi:long-subunit fatty acid transport protein